MSTDPKKCVTQRGLESLGLEEIAPRKKGESDLDYVKAVLTAHGLGYVERKGTRGASPSLNLLKRGGRKRPFQGPPPSD